MQPSTFRTATNSDSIPLVTLTEKAGITRDAGFKFIPGQFARLGILKEDGKFVWRPYSLCL